VPHPRRAPSARQGGLSFAVANDRSPSHPRQLHHPILRKRIRPKATPPPLLRFSHQPIPHRILMDVHHLLHPLFLRPYIEVVIPRLPHILLGPRLRKPLFQNLHSHRKLPTLRLSHEHMHMGRHHNIPKHIHRIQLTSPLQQRHKDIPRLRRSKNRSMTNATKRNVMKVATLLEPPQTRRHSGECTRRQASLQCPQPPGAPSSTRVLCAAGWGIVRGSERPLSPHPPAIPINPPTDFDSPQPDSHRPDNYNRESLLNHQC